MLTSCSKTLGIWSDARTVAILAILKHIIVNKMLTQNKFSSHLLKKLKEVDPFEFRMFEKQLEKALIGLSINITSCLTRYNMHESLGLTFEEAEQFSSQFTEKLRRLSMNILEQIKKSR